jgi:phenylalanyl-tRNA synthetase beta chain
MKATYDWLKEFVDFDISPEELAHAITMAGLEVEEIEEIDGDTVFDIGITPNRADCLSIRGIARDISAILGLPLKMSSVTIAGEDGRGPEVEILDPDLCHRYSARVIRDVKTGPSPDWMVRRLEACGIRPASNIVDVTNYVLLELGQPLHAFDLDRLDGGRILVQRAGTVDTFTTLDDEERNLLPETLLIMDGAKPVALAGVMGGQNTEVTDSTSNILLESAWFQPSSVRRTSKSLNLSTESSYRFERGVDKEAVTLALDRASQLIAELAGGSVSQITDIYPHRFASRKVTVSFERIRSLIGADIDSTFIEKTLGNLGFQVGKDDGVLSIVPPSFRDDIEMDVDIAEEIARLYGYDNIPATLPVIQMSHTPEHAMQQFIRTVKMSFVKSGYSEVINYSFVNPAALESLQLSPGDTRKKLIYIKNPLRQEESALRTSLVPALLNNVSMNLNRGEKELRFFEVSKVFLSSGEKLPREVTQAGIVYHKDKSRSMWENRHEGLYDLKGMIENMFSSFKIDVSFLQNPETPEPYLHPGRSCTIMIDDTIAGSLGSLHPAVAEAFDITGDITIAEFHDVEKMADAIPSSTTYVSLPKYPYTERDISVIVTDDVSVAEIRNEILKVDSEIIESVVLFDVYKGKPIPADRKSIAFGIRYRSVERTLTDSEVDQVHGEITERLKNTLHAELRS